MASGAHHLVQTRTVRLNDPDTGRLGDFEQVLHPAVRPLGIDVKFFDGRGFMAQTRRDGMEAEYDFIFHFYFLHYLQ